MVYRVIFQLCTALTAAQSSASYQEQCVRQVHQYPTFETLQACDEALPEIARAVKKRKFFEAHGMRSEARDFKCREEIF